MKIKHHKYLEPSCLVKENKPGTVYFYNEELNDFSRKQIPFDVETITLHRFMSHFDSIIRYYLNLYSYYNVIKSSIDFGDYYKKIYDSDHQTYTVIINYKENEINLHSINVIPTIC